jgi:hypothetical protein
MMKPAMRRRDPLLCALFVIVPGATASAFVACGHGSSSSFGNGGADASIEGGSGGGSGSGSGGVSSFLESGAYGAEASALGPGDFEDDPPPKWCGQGPDPYDAAVYGTTECPSDKNRQGCPCSPPGATAACWTGLRVDRDIGICKDGKTTCQPAGEGAPVWGPCVGEVLPDPGVEAGAEACKCFSTGTWAIANVEPCFGESSPGVVTGAVSTWVDNGTPACPTTITNPPTPQPGTTWSTDTLNVDCAGTFTLCYTIKAGNVNSPQPADCVVGQACTHGYIPTANVVTTLPVLPAWQGSDVACAQTFFTSGGYGEMSVYGESVICEEVGSMANPYVFEREPYCPQVNPPANCQSGGTGNF